MQVSKIVLQEYSDDETKDSIIEQLLHVTKIEFTINIKYTVKIISCPVFSRILLYSAVVVHMKSIAR